MLCLLTLFTCVHAGSFCFYFVTLLALTAEHRFKGLLALLNWVLIWLAHKVNCYKRAVSLLVGLTMRSYWLGSTCFACSLRFWHRCCIACLLCLVCSLLACFMWLGSFAWFACWLACFAWFIYFALLAWFVWLVGWLGWSVGWLISCLIGWPVGWLASLPPLLAQILFNCNSEV